MAYCDDLANEQKIKHPHQLSENDFNALIQKYHGTQVGTLMETDVKTAVSTAQCDDLIRIVEAPAFALAPPPHPHNHAIYYPASIFRILLAQNADNFIFYKINRQHITLPYDIIFSVSVDGRTEYYDMSSDTRF